MIVECPGCKSRYDVTGRPAGTRARCRCGTQFELPHPTQSAGTLGCPKCGGNVSPDCTHCTYCDAALKLQACPRCFARIFSGSKHCNHCGAKVEVAATVGATGDADPRPCPRCEDHSPLTARLVGDLLLDECHSCHGVFIDCETMERVIEQRDKVTAAELTGNMPSHEGHIAPTQPGGRMYIKCPDCEQIMNRVNFGRSSGILIDTCRAHGTWFDGGELPRVIEFVEKGLYVNRTVVERERARAEARARARSSSGASASMLTMSTTRHETNFGLFGSLLGGIASTLFDS